MNPRSESPDKQPQVSRADADPLASPTLAALYASQGHTDMAEGIYAQLGAQPAEAGPATARTLLQRLLSLREAARQVRSAGYGARNAGGVTWIIHESLIPPSPGTRWVPSPVEGEVQTF
jgi:hypothetical protein